MGVDKATLQYRGLSLLDYMGGILAGAGAVPVLNVGQPGGLADPVPDCGPVAGLLALHEHLRGAPPESWIVVPVDMPLLSAATLRRLAQTEAPAAHFSDEPLPFMIRMNPEIADFLSNIRTNLVSQEGMSLRHLLSKLGAAILVPDAVEAGQLVNFNTPYEWSALKSDGHH